MTMHGCPVAVNNHLWWTYERLEDLRPLLAEEVRRTETNSHEGTDAAETKLYSE